MSNQHTKTRKDFGVVVPPRSTADIESVALSLRDALNLSQTAFFPVVELYDMLHLLISGASYSIGTKSDMRDNHGLTLTKSKEIIIREDVFEKACDGDGFGRFTMCHELGHLMLHSGGVALQRAQANPPLYMSSEWQSDRFASALLMPYNLITNANGGVHEVMERFGVSYTAANVRIAQYESNKTKGATN